MSIFKKWSDSIKKNSIEGMRKEAVKQSRAQYDPNVMNPAIENALYQQQFGIADDAMRAKAVDATFRGTDADMVDLAGGNVAGALASQEQQSISRSERLANVMLGIDMEEEQAILEGRDSYAEALMKQGQITSERDASIHAANVQASAAKKQRNMQLLQTGIGAAVTLGTAGLGAPAVPKAGGAMDFIKNMAPTAISLGTQAIGQTQYNQSNIQATPMDAYGLQMPSNLTREYAPKASRDLMNTFEQAISPNSPWNTPVNNITGRQQGTGMNMFNQWRESNPFNN